jgi:ABC-2 type transport system ATP-binding protein
VDTILSITGLSKTYAGGHQALKSVDLEIRRGEIFALLGPNGAGKTTLISIGLRHRHPDHGQGRRRRLRHPGPVPQARSRIGLVPQELTTDAFETVLATVTFSRGLFGKSPNPAFIEQVLRDLSLWDKRTPRS